MLVVFNSLGEFKEVGWRNGLLPAELDAFDWVCLGVRQNDSLEIEAGAVGESEQYAGARDGAEGHVKSDYGRCAGHHRPSCWATADGWARVAVEVELEAGDVEVCGVKDAVVFNPKTDVCITRIA